MAAARNVYSLFGLMAITKEPIELPTWNMVWRQIINISTNSACNVVNAMHINNYKYGDDAKLLKLHLTGLMRSEFALAAVHH